MDKEYAEHPVFDKLSKYARFYGDLANSVMSFIPLGTHAIINIDSYIYSSMQGTLESIRDILIKGRINDAYALLRKFYDAAIINIYTNLYLDDHFDLQTFKVEKIDSWIKGKEQLPDIRGMNTYIGKSKQVTSIYSLLHKDKRYSELRQRCNDHTHYNFYYNLLLNDSELYLRNRISHLNKFSDDLVNIVILHLSYLFYINEHYMMASDYLDCLECGEIPDEKSQFYVAPFIQEVFDDVIKLHRLDIATEIKNKTVMMLE